VRVSSTYLSHCFGAREITGYVSSLAIVPRTANPAATGRGRKASTKHCACRRSEIGRCILSVRQAILRFRSGRSNHPIATDGASVWGWTPCTSVPTGQTRQRRLRRIRRQPSPQSTKSTMNVGPKRGLQLPLRPTANRFDSGHRRVRSPGDEVLEQEAAHLPNSRKCMKLHEYHGGRLPSARQTVPQLRPLPLRQWTRGLRCPPDMRGSLLRRCPGSRGDHPDRRT
jgi:hypothetical protein